MMFLFNVFIIRNLAKFIKVSLLNKNQKGEGENKWLHWNF